MVYFVPLNRSFMQAVPGREAKLRYSMCMKNQGRYRHLQCGLGERVVHPVDHTVRRRG